MAPPDQSVLSHRQSWIRQCRQARLKPCLCTLCFILQPPPRSAFLPLNSITKALLDSFAHHQQAPKNTYNIKTLWLLLKWGLFIISWRYQNNSFRRLQNIIIDYRNDIGSPCDGNSRLKFQFQLNFKLRNYNPMVNVKSRLIQENYFAMRGRGLELMPNNKTAETRWKWICIRLGFGP